MSGFEVAGLVLAIIPLLPAIKNIGIELSAGGSFASVSYGRYVSDAVRDIKYLDISLRSILRAALSPIIEDDDELKALIENPSLLGDQRDINERLSSWLGDKQDLFIFYCHGMHQTVMNVGVELHPNRKLYRRLWFLATSWDAMNKSLEKDCERLRHLLSDLKSDQAISKLRVSSFSMKRVEEYRYHFSNVLKSISKAWGCELMCRANHYANICLRFWQAPTFEMNLIFMQRYTTPGNTWICCDTTVSNSHPIEVINQPLAINISASSPSFKGSPSSSQVSLTDNTEQMLSCHPSESSIGNWRNKVYKVLKPERKNDRDHSTIKSKVTFELDSPQQAQDQGLVSIDNLCQRLRVDQPSYQRVGGLYEDDQCYKVSMNGMEFDDTWVLSLRSMLQNKSQIMTRKDRAFLAYTIADSHLRFDLNGRLPHSWVDGIIFHQEKATGNMDFKSPRVQWDLQALVTSSLDDQIKGFDALGIVLLELCFWETLDDYGKRVQIPRPHETESSSFWSLALARMWRDEVLAEAGLWYFTAVNWCLEARLKIPTLKQSDVRKELATFVVKQLEMYSKQFEF